jgi:hypothetical protein
MRIALAVMAMLAKTRPRGILFGRGGGNSGGRKWQRQSFSPANLKPPQEPRRSGSSPGWRTPRASRTFIKKPLLYLGVRASALEGLGLRSASYSQKTRRNPKKGLDTTSDKLYYVNYEIGLTSAPVSPNPAPYRVRVGVFPVSATVSRLASF